MADDLPSEFDVVVIGTGMPESILAAAFARIGQSVLHIDRNDHYSGQWASYNLEGIETWADKVGKSSLEHPDIDKSALEDGESLIPLKLADDTYHSHKMQYYIKEDLDSLPEEEVEQNSLIDKNQIGKESENQGGNESNLSGMEATSTDVISVDTGDKDTECDVSEAKVVSTQNDPAQSTTDTVFKEESQKAAQIDSSETQDVNTTKAQKDPPENQENVADQTDINTSEASDIKTPEATAATNTSENSESDNEKTETITEDKGDDCQIVQDKPQMSWTKSRLKKERRKFNLDLSPKLLYCSGSMVELLITSDIAKYCEFKTVSRILTLMNGKLGKVPCSRADVFSSKEVSMIEKRMMMKFLTFCAEFEQHEDEYKDFVNKPFKDYLCHKKLTKNVVHFIQHSISMTTDSALTVEGLQKTKKFLHSLGRYGNTAFLWPLYGSGEMPQSFCRMCAVFGGIYCLRMSASCLKVNKENKCCGIVLTSGQHIKCRWLVIENSYAPEIYISNTSTRLIDRGILVTDKSVMLSDDPQQLSLLQIPDTEDPEHPTTVLELPSSSMACPDGLYVVHLTKESSSKENSPEEHLINVIDILFQKEFKAGDKRPQIIWSLFFQQVISTGSETEEKPSNVLVVPGSGPELDMDHAVSFARSIFEKIMPEEDFLPRPPNPEDIIYVDEEETPVTQDEDQAEFNESMLNKTEQDKQNNEISDDIVKPNEGNSDSVNKTEESEQSQE